MADGVEVNLTGLDSVRQSLEDVFLHYYGEEMKGGVKG